MTCAARDNTNDCPTNTSPAMLAAGGEQIGRKLPPRKVASSTALNSALDRAGELPGRKQDNVDIEYRHGEPQGRRPALAAQ
jgi:hypothetical protein